MFNEGLTGNTAIEGFKNDDYKGCVTLEGLSYLSKFCYSFWLFLSSFS